MPGIFISFEGGEGAGKSTQIQRLGAYLTLEGEKVVITREPGGSTGAEVLRHILLSGAAQAYGHNVEVMLFAAARLDHMRETILPALDRGAIVLCDRFIDSTHAYQGGERGVSTAFLAQMERLAIGNRRPDLTFILDIVPEIGLQRVKARAATAQNKNPAIDRFEKDSLALQHKRRSVFLDIARKEPERCIVVDADQPSANVASIIRSHVASRLDTLKTTIRTYS